MRVVVLGAGTPLGQEVVEDLVFRGHHPTAVLDGEPVQDAHQPHLVDLAYGDITDTTWLASTVATTEAVVDVLSVSRKQAAAARARTATRHLVAAMTAHRVHRYVGLAPHHLYPVPGDSTKTAYVRQQLCQTLRPGGIAHTRDRFQMITGSGLRWTIVRTPVLSAGPARGVRHVHLRPGPHRRASLTQQDAARFLAAQVLETSLLWTSPLISN